MKISGTTKIIGILGNPIKHSLSPRMQNAAIAAMDLNYVYIPLEITDLPKAVQGLGAIDSVVGFNLTIPYKQEILPLLNQITDIAKVVGAVNTVKRTDEGWIGTNTDVYGFLTPLKKMDRNWQDCEVVVLGNGGAARAVVAGCFELGCEIVNVVGRNELKLRKFEQEFSPKIFGQSAKKLQVHTWSSLDKLLARAELVVNTTPIGMVVSSSLPLISPLTIEQINIISASAIIYDLIYTPRPTKLLQLAQARGLISVDGLMMLLYQGAMALEFWTGQLAPIAVMAAALEL